MLVQMDESRQGCRCTGSSHRRYRCEAHARARLRLSARSPWTACEHADRVRSRSCSVLAEQSLEAALPAQLVVVLCASEIVVERARPSVEVHT